jgi:hypothetical protein
MTVPSAVHRARERRPLREERGDDLLDRVGRHERHVDRHHDRAVEIARVDRIDACLKRGELTLVSAWVLDETRAAAPDLIA